MAKKTTTPAGSKLAKPKTDAPSERRKLDEEIRKLEERQASRAVDRAIRWARLIDQLEALLDRADDLYIHGVPLDFEDVERFHANCQSDPELAGGTLAQAREWLVLSAQSTLAVDLQLAENWLPMIGFEYRPEGSRAIADVRHRLEGKPFDVHSTPAEAIVYAINQVRTLLAYDVRLAKSFDLDRAPSEEDLDVLRRLRNKTKTAKDLAVEIAGKGNAYKTKEKQLTRTIERLKRVNGFDLPNERGSGYTLTPSDLARLDALDRETRRDSNET